MWQADPSRIDLSLDSRAVTFENPTGERGSGGSSCHGRKGTPSRRLAPGERVVLADLRGSGTLRHWWMTFPPAPPERMRALWIEVFYDGRPAPSVSVPCLDFFGLPHGRPVPFASALAAAQEGRGFNAYYPMPFRHSVRVELTNGSDHPTELFYQIDYTLESRLPDEAGYLHVTFRRENPTTQRRDFVIAEGLEGPGRFLGCVVGVRILDAGAWWGEGEVKIYRDGDRALPTICGTGLEDYVGSAWGLGPHASLWQGAPLEVRAPGVALPRYAAFYRWHVPDPVVFSTELRVTIQQIGFAFFREGDDASFERYQRTNPGAGHGWLMRPRPGALAMGIAERSDDYCAAAFVYCREPQAVPQLDLAAALANIAREAHEKPHPMEALFA
jgi:D-arabinan exo alpha-(1,3)/(1,5)-arabinofuranosidase (non-reducing end)